MNKKESRNPSSANCSHPCLKSKSNPSSSNLKQKPVSKYYQVISSDSRHSSKNQSTNITFKAESSFDSPYKNIISKVKEVDANTSRDDSDFKTPKPITQLKTLKLSQPQTKQRKKCKKAPSKNSTRKVNSMIQRLTEDQFSYSDVNPEHLQMAIALSKSVCEKVEEDKSDNITVERTAYTKVTLEKFGFKSDRTFPVEHKKIINTENPKKSKKSRFAFVRPILILRKPEDRESLIASKISLIITKSSDKLENHTPELQYVLNSDILRRYCCRNNTIFNTDLIYTNKQFYINSLNLPLSETRCDCLLKNWGEIFGRDFSPIRDNNLEKTDSENMDIEERQPVEDPYDISKNEPLLGNRTEDLYQSDFNFSTKIVSTTSRLRSISPDLFDFSDEDFFENGNNTTDKTDTQESLSKEIESVSDVQNNKYDKNTESPVNSVKVSIKDSLHWTSDNDKYLKNTENTINSEKGSSNDSLHWTSDNDEEDVLSQSLLSPQKSLSPRKLQKSFDWKTGGSIADSQEKNIEGNNYHIKEHIPGKGRKNDHKTTIPDTKVLPVNSGIEFYESYCADVDVFSQNLVIDLTEEDSDSDQCLDVNTKNESQENIINDTAIKLDSTVQNVCKETQMSQLVLKGTDSLSNSPKTVINDFLNDFEKYEEQNVSVTARKSLLDQMDKSVHSNCSAMLNVTDYITQMLNSDDGGTQGIRSSNNYVINNSHSNIISPFGDAEPLEPRSSQNNESDESCINDKELNYSCRKGNISSDDEVRQCDIKENSQLGIQLVDDYPSDVFVHRCDFSPDGKCSDPLNTSPKSLSALEKGIESSNLTPDSKFIIKTEHVTPVPNYDSMNTPKIQQELDKFGLKPLKRKRGAQLLKYIYDSTHPVIGVDNKDSSSDEDDIRAIKRGKSSNADFGGINAVEIAGDFLLKNETDELVFERKSSVTIRSCQIPLQIVWHNFLSCNPEIKESILLYEPLNLEVIHLMLKQQGFKFNVQDLLSFFDKKSITIRTASHSHRKKKRLQ